MATKLSPSESYSITIRAEIQNRPGMLGKVTTAIGNVGGDIGAVDLSGHGKGTVTRGITVRARGIDHAAHTGALDTGRVSDSTGTSP